MNELAMTPLPQASFRALADPTRRDILQMLAGEDLTIAEVSARFDMTRAAVRKHLTVLQEGDLIVVEARGREKINRLNPKGFAPVRAWLKYFDRFWDARLGALQAALERKDHEDDDDNDDTA